MKRALLIFSIIFVSDYSFSQDRCHEEAKAVEYWNDSLQDRVAEYKRERHRKAKEEFLLCLRKPATTSQDRVLKTRQNPNKVTTIQKVKRLNNTHTGKRPGKALRSSSLRMSHYTGFSGEKLNAWNKYYVESEECASNKGNITTFVKCSEERKRYIDSFDRRWDPIKKQLKLTID